MAYSPLVTDDTNGSAKSGTSTAEAYWRGVAAGEIAVVAGFRACIRPPNRDDDARERRLGTRRQLRLRGAISADRCDIYTDATASNVDPPAS